MSAPYYLAIDVRAETAAAAVAVGSHLDAVRTSAALPDAATVPTAVFVGSEDLLFGEDAVSRGAAEPDLLVGDFVTNLGAGTAVIVVDGEEFSPADLYAWTIDAVVSRVADVRGGRPRGVWAVVPDSWDDETIDALADAMDRDGHSEVDFITASEALAVRSWRVEPSDAESTLLVCDVDHRAFTAAVVRVSPTGHARPVGSSFGALLSVDGEADADLEDRALEAASDALESADADVDDLDAIVLAGVSDRVAWFEQLLAAEFGDPIGTEAQPALAAALGAAFALAREEIGLGQPEPVPTAAVVMPRTTGATHVVESGGHRPTAPPWHPRPVVLLGAAGAALVLAGGAFAGASMLDAAASPGDVSVGPSPSPGADRVTDASPQPTVTPSATPAPVVPTTPDAAVPAPLLPEAEAPRVPATPRSTNPTAPRAPIVEPAPPAVPDPPAAPEPVPTETDDPEPDPTDTEAPEPDPTQTVDPTPDPVETDDPAPVPPEDGESPAP